MRSASIDVVKIEMERLYDQISRLQRMEGKQDCYGGSKYTAAVRRASMDLTRALADLRGS